ncbi:MAG: DUF5658 family protein [Candidatus Caldarchaeum sp.]
MPCEYCLKHVRLKPQAKGLTNPEGLVEVNLDPLINFQIDVFRLVLAVVFYVCNVADYYTTKKGLEAGLREKNPFARAIMRMGWKRYQAIKLLGPALFVYQAMISDDPYYMWTASLVLGAGMFAYAGVQNALLIAGRRMRGEAGGP